MKSNRLIPVVLAACAALGCTHRETASVELSKDVLMDKIKGGWAGQTIGVVYGAPTEFKYTGETIQDCLPIPWSEHIVNFW